MVLVRASCGLTAQVVSSYHTPRNTSKKTDIRDGIEKLLACCEEYLESPELPCQVFLFPQTY
jgi:hypothetical protein